MTICSSVTRKQPYNFKVLADFGEANIDETNFPNYVMSCTRPVMQITNNTMSYEPMTLVLADDIQHVICQIVTELLENQLTAVYSFSLTLQTFDNNATLVEQWNITGCTISRVDHGIYSYYGSENGTEPLSVKLTINYTNAVLTCY